jgi:hypothetical protein
VLVALFMTRVSLIGLEFRRKDPFVFIHSGRCRLGSWRSNQRDRSQWCT